MNKMKHEKRKVSARVVQGEPAAVTNVHHTWYTAVAGVLGQVDRWIDRPPCIVFQFSAVRFPPCFANLLPVQQQPYGFRHSFELLVPTFLRTDLPGISVCPFLRFCLARFKLVRITV